MVGARHDCGARLRRNIDELAHHVRFLAAVVSNVKIELSSIERLDGRLEGFADNLSQLTAKSQDTLRSFQAIHGRLITHLKKTNHTQSLFEESHRCKLVTAAREIAMSVEAISTHGTVVAGIAGKISETTRQIGDDLGRCVVALQVGDSARQRLDHVSEALDIAVTIDNGLEVEGVKSEISTARIFHLQAHQVSAAGVEFETEIQSIARSMAKIAASNRDLLMMSADLVASPTKMSRSFLAELDRKLALARDLVHDCGQARGLVDETAAAFVASTLELEQMASSVGAMAFDMTIIGTNAVVASYRLGTDGVALSVIAQHLRAHALRVADEVGRLRPALMNVLSAANAFVSQRDMQNAHHMKALADRMSSALDVFRSNDQMVSEIRDALKRRAGTVQDLLNKGERSLEEVDQLSASIEACHDRLAGHVRAGELAAFDPAIADILRRRYTMAAERTIHDRILHGEETGPLLQQVDELDDFLL